MRLRPRGLAAAAVTLFVALALGACGTGDDPAGGSSVDGSSAPSGSSSQSGSPSGEESEQGASGASTAGNKAVDEPPAEGSTLSPTEFADMLVQALRDGRTASVKLDISGDYASRSTGVADFAAEPPAISLTTTVEALGASKVVMVDGVVYMQMGTGASEKYAKMDLGKSAEGSDFSQFDPEAGFRRLAAGFADITYVGEEKVGTEQLRHYRATVDAKTAKTARKAKLADGKVSYQAWFDREGHLRRVTEGAGDAATTMSYSNWGRKVSISAPPADQVVEMPSMPQSPPVDR